MFYKTGRLAPALLMLALGPVAATTWAGCDDDTSLQDTGSTDGSTTGGDTTGGGTLDTTTDALSTDTGDATDTAGTDGSAASDQTFRPRSNPVEYIGVTVQQKVTADDITRILGPVFGDEASKASFVNDYQLQPNLRLTSAADPRTPDQAVVTLDMLPVQPNFEADKRRTMTKVPVSFTYGKIFIDAVLVAIKTQDDAFAREPTSVQPWWIEYRARSANGGVLNIRVEQPARLNPATDPIVTLLSFSNTTPETSLTQGSLGGPAFKGDPYETIAGTVWFSLSGDEFDFFVQRAYGLSAGAAQNFRDFQLLPHKWLRLTVTPNVKQKIVDVAFEVVTIDGRRVPIARAPASYIAGDQFKQAVFVQLDQMAAQEQVQAGSSAPWEVPFHYDDPQGGGVVRVVATGKNGAFTIAYAVESPIRFLKDTDFVPYPKTMDIPDELPVVEDDCSKLGSVAADSGKFVIKFNASSTIRRAEKNGTLKAPLKGTVYGSIYRSEDVTIAGPKEGTEAVLAIKFENIDATLDGVKTAPTFEIPASLPSGDYQLLGFLDIDGNADPSDPDPDTGDPVMVPIGGYKLLCEKHPITVEFAILLPKGY